MAMIDIIDTEIQRRKNATADLIKSQQEMIAAVEQFNKLDEFYRSSQLSVGGDLRNVYKENRHFSGKDPLIYTLATTETYPFFNGTDAASNPYFPITKVQDKTYNGIDPFYAAPTKTGVWQRDVTYTATEDIPRNAAKARLNAFPDLTGEPLPDGWPGPATVTPGYCTGDTPPGATDQVTCNANGGIWTPPSTAPDPVWIGANTAPALLRTALNAWKTDIQAIQADLYLNDSAEYTYWQGIISDIDIVLAAVATDAVFVRATGNPDPAAWGQTQPFTGATETARQNLITASTAGISNHVTVRKQFLDNKANSQEQAFFGVIKLRLHQANGSYAKLQAAKSQQDITKGLIADNESAIKSLNLIKVQNS